MAHLNGAEVYVAEVIQSIWDAAKAAGAVKVAMSITEFTDDDLDVIVDLAGFGTTTADAIKTVKSGGRVVQVGLGKLESTIVTYARIMNQAQVHGSGGGTKEDISEVMKWMASGDLTPKITTIGFEEIAEGISRLERGEVQGRLVANIEQ